MSFILEKKVFLAKEYLLHLINKCSSSSTASQLHCLHILFSTAVFGIVYLPLSISSLCALIRKRARVDRFDNSFILSKYFSCWNINLNLQYVRNLFSFLLVAGFYLTKLIFSLQIFVFLSFNLFLIIFISLAPQVSGDLNIFNISSSFKI